MKMDATGIRPAELESMKPGKPVLVVGEDGKQRLTITTQFKTSYEQDPKTTGFLTVKESNNVTAEFGGNYFFYQLPSDGRVIVEVDTDSSLDEWPRSSIALTNKGPAINCGFQTVLLLETWTTVPEREIEIPFVSFRHWKIWWQPRSVDVPADRLLLAESKGGDKKDRP